MDNWYYQTTPPISEFVRGFTKINTSEICSYLFRLYLDLHQHRRHQFENLNYV